VITAVGKSLIAQAPPISSDPEIATGGLDEERIRQIIREENEAQEGEIP